MNSIRFRFRLVPSAIVGGFLFALFMVAGQSLAETGGFSQMIGGALRVAVSLAKLLLYAAVLSLLLSLLFSWLDGRARHAGPVRAGRLCGFVDRHVFGLALALLAVCWGAYVAVFALGTLTYDGARSLNQFCAGAPLENHHPVLMNLLYGLLMHVGRVIGSDDWSVFLGGNGTLIGASANVVMSDNAKKHGTEITFIGFMKYGFPTMLATVAVSAVYLIVRFPPM